MGRFYRPPSEPEEATESETLGTPEGRFYRPSSGVAVPEDMEDLKAPAKSAAKKDWAAYAKSLGATDSEVKSLNRDALADKYGPKDSDETPSAAPAASVDAAAETVQPNPVEAAKDLSVATGALEPPADADTVVTDAAAETVQEDPIEAAEEVAGPPGANQPSGNASREDWVVFAKSRGATDEDLEGLGRNEIRSHYQSDLI